MTRRAPTTTKKKSKFILDIGYYIVMSTRISSWSSSPTEIVKVPLSERSSLPTRKLTEIRNNSTRSQPTRNQPNRPKLQSRTSFGFQAALKEEGHIDLGSPRPRVLTRTLSTRSSTTQNKVITVARKPSLKRSPSKGFPPNVHIKLHRTSTNAHSLESFKRDLTNRKASRSLSNENETPLKKRPLVRRTTLSYIPKCKVSL